MKSQDFHAEKSIVRHLKEALFTTRRRAPAVKLARCVLKKDRRYIPSFPLSTNRIFPPGDPRGSPLPSGEASRAFFRLRNAYLYAKLTLHALRTGATRTTVLFHALLKSKNIIDTVNLLFSVCGGAL